jgi:hypothetical protein
MCVRSNSIFFFLSDFLLASVGWFSIVPHSYKSLESIFIQKEFLKQWHEVIRIARL